MQAVAKTRHINIRFKPRTPARVINTIKRQYSEYIDDDDELVDISTTDWYRQMRKDMTPGKSLKTLREVTNLTQAKIGEMIGIPTARISDFETGQRAISKVMAKKLAAVFNTSPAVFI
ncbi:MAG: helix-turn-helix transcriptional regulator [Chitinispirillaceae bacterium]|nr:helix-turn-helix transcriptional regulator [Chitinispirillaceae bacterium]